ncbi:DUF1671-domain-containing protein [Aureobasidium pullulans]|uniref:DUF1671-domain-containing protein n=1 Tax=Aureobasidium pullulans TaxID=5580 RepID=A0AB74IRA9_AURPU|nr:DUF1671-domain-containing protein [Aureobasidium pullulans]
MECPFLCGFHTPNDSQAEYHITAHIELQHTPESQFTVEDEDLKFALALQREEEQAFADIRNRDVSSGPSLKPANREKEGAANDDFPYAECPECEEFVHLIELDEHMNTHLSLKYSSDDMAGPDFNEPSSGRPSFQGSTKIARHRGRHDGQPFGKENVGRSAKEKSRGMRLGKTELGPHAFEERMPEWMLKKLQEGEPVRRVNRIGRNGQLCTDRIVDNEVPGLVPVIANLCTTPSNNLQAAYVCHPSVQHVFRGQRQTHFCGYRNIQMLVSYLQGTKARDHERFGKNLPGVLRLQEMIEEAWDDGNDVLARQETGGILNTRKWIGTPEVESLCLHLNLPYFQRAFSKTKGKKAHEELLDFVENYFARGSADEETKIHKTHQAPIYFQQPGHSLTIVGLERFNDGSRNLLVFDPSFGPSQALKSLLVRPSSATVPAKTADHLLKSYRRTIAQLAKYDEFEVLV